MCHVGGGRYRVTQKKPIMDKPPLTVDQLHTQNNDVSDPRRHQGKLGLLWKGNLRPVTVAHAPPSLALGPWETVFFEKKLTKIEILVKK